MWSQGQHQRHTPYGQQSKGGWGESQQQSSGWSGLSQNQQSGGWGGQTQSGFGAPPKGGFQKGEGKGMGKGGKKGWVKPPSKNPTSEEQKATKDAAFLQIATNIVPTISLVIDEKGGFASLGEVSQDPRVLEALATIPDGHKKTAKAVVEKFPDFISCFEGGRVATAKGYEAGYVNYDGTVNPKPKKKPEVKKEQPVAAPIVKKELPVSAPKFKATGHVAKPKQKPAQPPPPAQPARSPGVKPMKDLNIFPNDKAKLTYLATRMTILCERGSDEEIEHIFDQVKEYRMLVEEAKANPGPKLNGPKPPRPGSVEDISSGMDQASLIDHMVKAVKEMEESGEIAHLMQLGNCKAAMEVKTALRENKCPRTSILFKKFPLTFAINDGIVSVLDSYIPFMDQDPVFIEDPKREAYLEKKRKYEEAVANGEIIPEEKPAKKVKTEEPSVAKAKAKA